MKNAARGGDRPPPREQRRVALGDGARAGTIADQQAPGDLAIAAAREREEALRVLVEQAWVNRGTRLVPSRFARETSRHRLR